MNCLMIEDEEAGRIQLRKLMKEVGGLKNTGEAGTCAEGLELLKRHPETDLIFLDVELPDGTGFDLIEKIKNPPKVIFITHYEAYALRAFEINALDYIQKPLTRARLESALERLDTQSHQHQPTQLKPDDLLLLADDNQKYFTRVTDIIAIESDENYTHVTRSDGKHFIIRKTLAAWEAQLPAGFFIRAGRRHLINMKRMDRMVAKDNGGLLWFKDTLAPLKISRPAMKQLQQSVRAV